MQSSSSGPASSGSTTSVAGGQSLDTRLFNDTTHGEGAFVQLQEFRISKFLCDVEIQVGSEEFPCHRVVLAATIPYFKSMFSSDMVETKSKRITIKDITVEAMEALLTFAYTGRIQLTTENVQPLLYAASILQMDSVCRACEDFLTHYLTTSNCLVIRSFAQQHNCVQLMRNVDAFSQEYFPVMDTDDFLNISFPHLLDLTSSPDLNVSSEVQVFETIIKWVSQDTEARMRYLPRLLSRVRLCQLEPAYLLNNVKGHKWIKEEPECGRIVANAMACQMVSANLATTATHVTDYELCRPRKSVAGVIFCVGGRGTSGDPFRSIEAYDLRKNRWVSVAEMGTKRRHVGVVSAKGHLFAIGGHDGHEHLASAEKFDPSTSMWRVVTPMATQRRGIAVGYLGGAIYAVGGLDDSACFNTVERYDIEADQWSFVASMNVMRGGVGVSALKGHLYAVGGNDGSSSLDSCERYDPHLNKWSLAACMSHRRAGAGVVVLNGCLYAIGGFDDNSPLNTCERYNPESNAWDMIPHMSCPRGGVGVAAIGGKIYAVGGHDGVSYLNSVESYDPLTNRWESVAAISQCRAGAGVAWCSCAVTSLQPVGLVGVAACV